MLPRALCYAETHPMRRHKKRPRNYRSRGEQLEAQRISHLQLEAQQISPQSQLPTTGSEMFWARARNRNGCFRPTAGKGLHVTMATTGICGTRLGQGMTGGSAGPPVHCPYRCCRPQEPGHNAIGHPATADAHGDSLPGRTCSTICSRLRWSVYARQPLCRSSTCTYQD